MTRFVANRLLQAFASLFGVLTVVFFAVHIAGNPVRLLVPQNSSAADIARLSHHLGLDRPLLAQYATFLDNAVHGNFGYSFVQNQPALRIVLSRFPNTVELALGALVFAIALAIPIGMLTAIYRGKWIERALMPIILVGQSMPVFWSGILLILIFAVHWHIFPSSGQGGLKALILPSVTLGSLSLATIARMVRGSFLEQLNKDYVRTAKAKGASTARVLTRHVLRNGFLPVLTILGLEVANLLGGAVITEDIFAWPGIGQLTVQSVQSLDFPVVEAVVLFSATIFILVNLLVDLLYGVVDPRISHMEGV